MIPGGTSMGGIIYVESFLWNHFLTGGFMGGVNPPENDFQFDVTDVPDLFSHVAMS